MKDKIAKESSNFKPEAKTYLVEVAPLTKSRGQGTLSYFSLEKPSPGTLVKIPVRNGFARGVVLGSRSASSAKSEIRQADFALRKIAKRDISNAGLSSGMLDAVKKSSLYYATSPGNLLNSLLPKMALENPEKFFQMKFKKKPDNTPPETLLLQMETEERYGQYRALVRQAFARKSSVILVAPTHHDVMRAGKLLSAGIEPYVYTFSLKDRQKDAELAWTKALADEHSILFITTPAGIAFEREDIDTIILERENSRAYRTLSSPYIHYKVILEKLARETRRKLILGDSVLSLEVMEKEKRGEYGELSLVRWRLPAAPAQLIDTSRRPDSKGKFEIFSPELKSLIKKAVEEKSGIFLFGARKGLAPSTVCGDCGFLLPCLNCGAPTVLHRQRSGENIYICHACSSRRDSATKCGYCGSWKLVPLGIGIERIATEAKALFPKAHIEILDKDYAPTDAKAKGVAKRFKEDGGILVGTELALFHLEKVPYAALVSADSLFSIPDFGIHERIFYLVSRLRELAQHETIIQTRNIGKQILAWAALGNIIDFYLGEIAERKTLLYPPFSLFIKITSLSNRPSEIGELKERLLRWRPEIYKDSLLVRLHKDEWPDPELSRILSLLGPQFSIKVDPESIL